MAVRTILIYPDPILATQSEPIDEITEEVKTLAHDMLETMVAARDRTCGEPGGASPSASSSSISTPSPGEEEEGGCATLRSDPT